MKIALFLSCALFCALTLAAIPEHEVKSLPGFDGPLRSKHYSGYLPVGNLSGTPGFIHYWFIECETDPANAPVAYWTNGGPGGSGISTGLLTEMGQIHANDNSFNSSKSNLEVFYNPYSWSKVANMLYVSQPKGVGFSYCTNANSPDECVNNDLTSAQDGYEFFLQFFEHYPEYKQNEFFLTSESYGGIYIPLMMQQIDKYGGLPNFKGAAIGDGCWGTDVGMCATGGKQAQINVEFFQGHAMYDQPLYQRLLAACGNWTNESIKAPDCVSAYNEMNSKLGTFDLYNVYDTCNGDTEMDLLTYNKLTSARTVVLDNHKVHQSAPHPSLSGALNDYVCGGGRAASAWLSEDAVAEALHVKPGTPGMKYNWGPSNVSGDLRPLYKELAQKYRLMIYSGDTDGCVPEWGTEEWVRELGFPIKKDWRPWRAPLTTGAKLQRAGYVIDYAGNTVDFKFVTVQGSGHMVPTYKPSFALTAITKFFKGEEF